MAEQNEFKPVGERPQGWHFKNPFVDDEGNVFRKGVHCPEEKGKFPPTSGKEVKKTAEVSQESTQQEVSKETPQQENLYNEIPPELLEKLKATFNEQFQEEKKKMLEEFRQSLQKTGQPGIDEEALAKALIMGEQIVKGGKVYRTIEDLDPEDFDEKGVTFTSYGNGYLIVDDVRKGHPVRTPYGRVFKFRFNASRITQVGKTQEYSAFCTFKTNSKKEIEWLRSHTLYNVDFFEDAKVALSADAIAAQVAVRMSRIVNSLDQSQILRRAKEMNITIGGDLADIKQLMILQMTQEELKRQGEAALERSKEAYEKEIFDK